MIIFDEIIKHLFAKAFEACDKVIGLIPVIRELRKRRPTLTRMLALFLILFSVACASDAMKALGDASKPAGNTIFVLKPVVNINFGPTSTASFEGKMSDVAPLSGGGFIKSLWVKEKNTGNSQTIDAILLFDRASWEFGSSQEIIDPTTNPGRKARRVDLAAMIENPDLKAQLANYEEVWGLGLVSSVGNRSPENSDILSRKRAIKLCEILVRNPDLDGHTVSAIPLGQHGESLASNDGKESWQERRERAVVIFGIRARTGHIDQDKFLRELFRDNRVLSADRHTVFLTSDYDYVLNLAKLDWAVPVRESRTCRFRADRTAPLE